MLLVEREPETKDESSTPSHPFLQRPACPPRQDPRKENLPLLLPPLLPLLPWTLLFSSTDSLPFQPTRSGLFSSTILPHLNALPSSEIDSIRSSYQTAIDDRYAINKINFDSRDKELSQLENKVLLTVGNNDSCEEWDVVRILDFPQEPRNAFVDYFPLDHSPTALLHAGGHQNDDSVDQGRLRRRR